jgi:hypothetical protein
VASSDARDLNGRRRSRLRLCGGSGAKVVTRRGEADRGHAGSQCAVSLREFLPVFVRPTTARRRNESTFPRLCPFVELRRHEHFRSSTLIRAVEDARRILGDYIEIGPRDATRTVEHLLDVLDRNDVLYALDRMKRRRAIRLVESNPIQE